MAGKLVPVSSRSEAAIAAGSWAEEGLASAGSGMRFEKTSGFIRVGAILIKMPIFTWR